MLQRRYTLGRTEKSMLERGMIVPASFLLLQCNVMKPQDKVRRNRIASLRLIPSRGIYEEEDKYENCCLVRCFDLPTRLQQYYMIIYTI